MFLNYLDVPPSSVQAFSGEYVEPKRCGRSLVAVILGKTVAHAAQSGMIVPSLLAEPLPSQLRAQAESSEAPGESLFVSDDEEGVDIMNQGEPETQMGGWTSRQVVHRLEDNESGLLSLSPTGYPDEDLRNAPDGANMLTVPDDQTADHEAQPVAPSMPADNPDLVSSQGGGTAAGSRDRRIGPFLVSPTPSPPSSPHLAPTEEQSSQEVASASTQQKERCVFQIFPKAPSRVPMTYEQYLEALDSVCDSIMRLTLSFSDAADSTGPMPVAAPVAGSAPQSENREPAGVSAPALSATTASALQTATLGSATQVSGPATAFPSAGMFGAATRWTEIQPVGNSLESGGLGELSSTICEIEQVFDRPTIDMPMPGSQGQFSTPAGPYAEQTEPGFSVPSYPNPNGEQFEEYSAAQALITPVDPAIVTQSTFYSQGPTWTSMQANDVELEMRESPMAPSSMPSNGWVDAALPRPEIGLLDRPATQDAPVVVGENGPVGEPVSAYTTPTIEESPAVPTEVSKTPLPSTNLEQPSIPMPPSELEEVRPVVDSTSVEPTSSQTDSISSGEQLEARPSEPLPSAPEPATTLEGPKVQSTQVATPVEAATPPAATTDEIPAVERGSWCMSSSYSLLTKLIYFANTYNYSVF